MNRRTLLAWISYDFANSSYALLIPAVLFPLYLQGAILVDPAKADLTWGLMAGGATVLSGLVSPIIGAVADFAGWRHYIFRGGVVVAAGMTALLAILEPGSSLALAAVLYIAGALAFNATVALYDAFLPVVATESNLGRVSGWGWGLGYLGGLACLFLVLPVVGSATPAAQPAAFQRAFLVTAAFFAALSLPAFFALRDAHVGARPHLREVLAIGARRVMGTLAHIKEHRRIFVFLAAFYLLSDGMSALYFFSSAYARTTLGLSTREILMLLVVVQLLGVPSTILGGWMSDRLGEFPVLRALSASWLVTVAALAFVQGKVGYYALAALIGALLGPTQAVARAALARMVPLDKRAEFFGFNALAARFSASLAPVLFGVVSTMSGSQRAAVLSTALFFGLASVLLRSKSLRPIQAA